MESWTPEEFDQLIAYDRLEPIGVMPVLRLLVFIASKLANQNDDEESEPVTMKMLAEWAGLPTESFETDDETQKFTPPNVASKMFRR